MSKNNEIVIYQASDSLQLQVRLENDTVWLNRNQMALLFGRDVKTIGKHIANALNEELSVVAKNAPTPTIAKNATVQLPSIIAKFATVQQEGTRTVIRNVEYYSLDVILSVGYRVKSTQGIAFRQWANQVLKQYLYNGYVFNKRFERIEHRLANVEARQDAFDIEIHASLPPTQGVFFEGQVFDARCFVEGLIRSAKKSIILIDNYVNSDVIAMLNERENEVQATIYTDTISSVLQKDEMLNEQQTGRIIALRQYSSKFHDRFLIIDEDLYHFGASFKDLGKRLFAFDKMNIDKDIILNQL